MRQLDDENREVVTAAIQACGRLEVPGVQAKLLALLDRSKVPDPGRVLYWLSEGPLTEEVLDAAIRVSNQQVLADAPWGASLFEAFARSDDAELRKRARNELKRQLDAWPDDGRRGYSGSRIGLISALSETSDHGELEWLKTTFEQEQGDYAAPLLVALVRLEGNEGKSQLLELLDDPERRSTAVQAAGEVFAGSGDEEIAGKLAQLAQLTLGYDESEVMRICAALQGIGGEPGRKELVKIVEHLSPAYRASFLRGLAEDGLTLEDIKMRIVSAGLIDGPAAEVALQQLQSRAEEEEMGAPGLLDVLNAAGIAFEFDAETDMLPCRHDNLVAEFAAHSRGVFTPRAVSEQFHQRDEEDFDAEYTLRFVYGGKLYAGRLRNFGDWYDVERTVSMINRALADAQRKERFVALATDGQVASFVFADPERLAPLAEEFHVPLGLDPNEAMNKGQAFEREVLEKLEPSEP